MEAMMKVFVVGFVCGLGLSLFVSSVDAGLSDVRDCRYGRTSFLYANDINSVIAAMDERLVACVRELRAHDDKNYNHLLNLVSVLERRIEQLGRR
jgi:hypothetical protein